MSIADEFFTQAMQLPTEDRELLAVRLLGSLERPSEQSYEDAWETELASRLAEYDAGRAQSIPSEEVFVRILETLRPSPDE